MRYKREKDKVNRFEMIKNKEDTPIMSIITPYFNAEDYIEETAKSVLSQTFASFEWIIVDDGSAKKAKDKIKEIEKIIGRSDFIFANSKSLESTNAI